MTEDFHDHGNATGSACDSREPACRDYLERSGKRCTFDAMYPAAPLGCEKNRNYVKLLKEPAPCFWCGTLTQWVEINYQGPLCSPRCEDEIGMDVQRLSQEHERKYGTGESGD